MIEEAELVRALRAPVAPPVERLVARVMARLPAAPAPRRARWPALALALAAAAVLMLYLRPRVDDWRVTARGGAPSDLARLVGVELYALGGELVPLAPGTAVAPDTAYVAAYRHAGRAPAFALVFAVDSAGEVHWLYPAFTDPARDPLSLALAPAPLPQLLAEAVVLDAPAPGPLTLCALVTPAPLRVSEIERAPHSLAALRARWPALRTLTVVVQPR